MAGRNGPADAGSTVLICPLGPCARDCWNRKGPRRLWRVCDSAKTNRWLKKSFLDFFNVACERRDFRCALGPSVARHCSVKKSDRQALGAPSQLATFALDHVLVECLQRCIREAGTAIEEAAT